MTTEERVEKLEKGPKTRYVMAWLGGALLVLGTFAAPVGRWVLLSNCGDTLTWRFVDVSLFGRGSIEGVVMLVCACVSLGAAILDVPWLLWFTSPASLVATAVAFFTVSRQGTLFYALGHWPFIHGNFSPENVRSLFVYGWGFALLILGCLLLFAAAFGEKRRTGQ